MRLIDKVIQKFFLILIQSMEGKENLIKFIEYIRVLYRYPTKMLGRKLPNDLIGKTDVLVFAAHPDDDILGLGTTLYRHSLTNDNIKVIFVTNGSGLGGESWHINGRSSKLKADIRYREAVSALSLINIPSENIYCLGFPDAGTQRYIKDISDDVFKIVQKLNPRRIYVHCIEGGHRDHDLTSYVVKSVCKQLGHSQLYEWTEYNPIQPLGTHNVQFLPSESKRLEENGIIISETERLLKKRMLALHQSQDVEQFFHQGEAIRPAKMIKVENELFLHSQFSKEKLTSMVESFNKWVYKMNKKSIKEGMHYDNKESIEK